MSEAAKHGPLSDALVAFALGGHGGVAFDEAVAAGSRLRAAATRIAVEPNPALRDRLPAPLALALARGARFADEPALASYAAPIAAALTAGERAAATTRALDEAIAVGCEIAARMRRALDEPRLAERWNVATVSGIIAAVGAAARVGGLDVGRARHAFGIAATQAAGTGVTTGTPAGALASGKAASDAVEAVALAGAGFTGPAAPIEGRRGLAALIAERVVDDALVTGLGARWEHSRT